ncbi:MAG: hypothetical protein JW724_08220 [Candidatus Altiarchaeota archaeon]|nr:hypothetical protein [Candidatus Altiarchaeota archaeon]
MRKTLAILTTALVIMGSSMGCGSGGSKEKPYFDDSLPHKTSLPTEDIFSGDYKVLGPEYEASLNIHKTGQGYHLEWTFPDGAKHYGKGIAMDGILGAVYDVGDGSRSGVVAYKKSGNGISGLWTPAEGGSIAYEKTADAVGLKLGRLDTRGDYNIIGTNEDSTSYKGTLKIEESGPVLAAHWVSGQGDISGTGLEIDDVIVVGYGNQDGAGVAVYEIHGTNLNGFWLFCPYNDFKSLYPIRLGMEKATQ